jgi:Major Vault Protein repeat domain
MQSFIYLKDNEALMLKAERGFIDERSREEKKERFVNDEYLYKGPGTYIPRIEESVSLKLTA